MLISIEKNITLKNQIEANPYLSNIFINDTSSKQSHR